MNGARFAFGLGALLAVSILTAAPAAADLRSHEGMDDHPPDEVNPEGDHDHTAHPSHGSLDNVGAKLANPLSNLWSLQFNFQAPGFFDGDLNSGSPEVGGNVIIQPVMPLPMYGSGEDEWRYIVRPVIPVVFTQPIPEGPDDFSFTGGLGDIQLQTALAPPASFTGLPKSMIFGIGPALGFATATDADLGSEQFSAGPALALGWKTKQWTAVIFPSYLWGYASRSDRDSGAPDVSQLSFLYSFVVNLPQAWQIGLNPTITYDRTAANGNKWNVPIGLFAGRTIKIGRLPVNIRAGLEYSVVSQDAFGKRAQFRFQITPVVPSLIQKSIFGGE